VSSLHRLLSSLEALRAADVVIVVAGTDGALAPVVAGLVDAPVVSEL
jgi:NCAIR mutase (PurE)-related protein